LHRIEVGGRVTVFVNGAGKANVTAAPGAAGEHDPFELVAERLVEHHHRAANGRNSIRASASPTSTASQRAR
jgi:hypothetical protein